MPDPTAAVPAAYAVGEIRVVSLPDGALRETTAVLHGLDAEEAVTLLHAAGEPPGLVLAIGAYLVRTEGMLVLLDAGCGDGMGPAAGLLDRSLRQAGVAADEIGLVILTHMHPDHIGGLLTADGTARFPHARILAPEADAAVFLDTTIAASVPDAVKPVFAKARAVAAAYAGRFDTFQDGSAVAPGIVAVPLPGHSPGHSGFRIAHGEHSLLVWGDVVHVPALQFAHPDVGMIFDSDPALAAQTRRAAFAAAAASGETVAGMHMPFPGFARVAAAGAAYRFEAVPVLRQPEHRQ